MELASELTCTFGIYTCIINTAKKNKFLGDTVKQLNFAAIFVCDSLRDDFLLLAFCECIELHFVGFNFVNLPCQICKNTLQTDCYTDIGL